MHHSVPQLSVQRGVPQASRAQNPPSETQRLPYHAVGSPDRHPAGLWRGSLYVQAHFQQCLYHAVQGMA